MTEGFQPLMSGTRGNALWGPGTYFARDAKPLGCYLFFMAGLKGIVMITINTHTYIHIYIIYNNNNDDDNNDNNNN